MASGFKFTADGRIYDLEDALVRRDQLSAGSWYACGLDTDHMALNRGPAGNTTPFQPSNTGGAWVDAAVTRFSSVGVRSDGTLWGTGNDEYHNLGSYAGGVIYPYFKQESLGAKNWSKVRMQDSVTLALRSDNSMWVCGYGAWCMGLAYIVDTAVNAFTRIGTANNWAYIDGGRGHQSQQYWFAIDTDGKGYSWGDGVGGQLAQGDQVNYSVPVAIGGGIVWKKICGSVQNAIGLATNGKVYIWGTCYDVVMRTAPLEWTYNGQTFKDAAIWASGIACITSEGRMIITTAGGTFEEGYHLTDWVKLFSGHSAIFGLKADGTLWSYGGEYGNNGVNGTTITGIYMGRESTFRTDWKLVNGGYRSTIGLTDATI